MNHSLNLGRSKPLGPWTCALATVPGRGYRGREAPTQLAPHQNGALQLLAGHEAELQGEAAEVGHGSKSVQDEEEDKGREVGRRDGKVEGRKQEKEGTAARGGEEGEATGHRQGGIKCPTDSTEGWWAPDWTRSCSTPGPGFWYCSCCCSSQAAVASRTKGGTAPPVGISYRLQGGQEGGFADKH